MESDVVLLDAGGGVCSCWSGMRFDVIEERRQLGRKLQGDSDGDGDAGGEIDCEQRGCIDCYFGDGFRGDADRHGYADFRQVRLGGCWVE